MRFARALPALFAVALLAGPVARADTTCTFGGPTPGFRAAKVFLPDGSDFATIRLTSARPAMLAGDRSSWHLAVGFAIINVATREMVSSRVVSSGYSTRRVVIEENGTDVVRQEIIGPDAPFERASWIQVGHLDPGSYYLVGFGSDGDVRNPNPWWGADFHLGPDVSCAPVGEGEIFDLDYTQFHGGTQFSASVAGVAMSEHGGFATSRSLVFGLMDVRAQGAGMASLDYAMPGGITGTLSNQIVPFVSTAGTYAFTASFSGAFPVVVVAAVALDPS